MTRKDYEIIAAAIKNAAMRAGNDSETVDTIVYEIAHQLALDNPRFDADRFAAACRPN